MARDHRGTQTQSGQSTAKLWAEPGLAPGEVPRPAGPASERLSPSTLAPRPSPTGELVDYPPPERWDDWVEYDGRAWPRRVTRRYMLVPTTCFNCESACGLLAYIDKDTLQVQKFEGNPVHPGSRGRNCAKGPATLNQIQDPDRILYPLKRAGKRGEGRWARCSWDEALDAIAAKIRAAIVDDRKTEVMYHVGRPGEDGYMERVLQSWGIDGHNSHTNICSSGGRFGYAVWMGIDRPSPDYANARYTLLVSAHLESGHYFNPHAQRIIESTMKGGKLCVIDPRLSNTASMATDWLPAWPGTEAALLLAFANVIIQEDLYDRDFLRRWVNWEEYLRAEPATGPDGPGGLRQRSGPTEPVTFETFERILKTLYAPYTPEFAERESGIDAATVVRVAREIGAAGSAFCAHNWRAAAAGNLGGWQVPRALFFLNVLTGSVGTVGGTSANIWDKWVPAPFIEPPKQKVWNELSWPREYPLAHHEMSFLLPHFLKEGRGKLAMYFTRVYNPVWTNPDGLTWLEVLTDETKIELHAALTPVWSESAWFADYVLPMGLGSERHDVHSYETHAGQWLGFRQPVLRAARERLGETIADTRQVNPGEVWEENEFWIELSWRIDPDGSLGIRRYFESPDRPGQKVSVDEYYGWMFEHSVPGLPEAAEKEGLTPLQYMRRYGSFEIASAVYQPYERVLSSEELAGTEVDSETGIIWRLPHAAASHAAPGDHGNGARPATRPNMVPKPAPPPRADGATRAGLMVDGVPRAGWPTPSGKLELYSSTLRDWGWPEYALPGYIRSHVHPGQMDRSRNEFCLVPTFRLPVLIHTRSGNAKWLNEIAHSNPLWVHPIDAARLSVKTGDLVRVSTEIGYFVPYVWVTEGLRPGVVACSHHMGRWRLQEGSGGDRWSTGVVDLERTAPGRWLMRLKEAVHGFASDDPDSSRVWWTDAGVHQNLTFPVHPDPVSGAHSWHQKVRVERAHPEDRYADVSVDTARAHEVYREWLARARPAPGPGGLRRPLWLLRPYRPDPSAYKVPESVEPERR